ncbi:MAG: DUF3079 domain-containing protein [Undibacterium sp.]|uniref:DUF3079 domain-containing protein n=1 Tax=Undibacterium sp. TaxID=1914977 RepID=UPI00271F6D6F|nr:DUF3079 domain-containing protein [Undibacterium sp.]MDO8651760.1 DUF3079 domain-containing protein [Undibacterium sp.]
MAKKFSAHPEHPERLCWGCDKYCPADSLICGNGSERTQHPVELFGEDWQEWVPGNKVITIKNANDCAATPEAPKPEKN